MLRIGKNSKIAGVIPLTRYGIQAFSSTRMSTEEALSSLNKDLVFVDLNKQDNPDARHFFEYQTGRWLTNDRAEREARRVNFSLKGLFEVLQEKADVTGGGASIETIEPMFEGKHNKLYRIDLKDQRRYVARIPYNLGLPEYRSARLQSEAATLEFLASRVFEGQDKFRATAPVSYSATSDNPLESPYMLLSYVEGKKLASEWKPWVTDIEEKLPVITPMAEMAAMILKHKFPAYGSIFFKDDTAAGYETVPIDDKFVIGPSMEKRFWRSEVGKPFRGPFKTWQEYVKATADVQVAYAKAETGDSSPNTRAAERYAQLVPHLFGTNEVHGDIGSSRLYDRDFSPINVLVQEEDNKYWLLDIENSVCKPYVFHGVPWFVRNPGERIYRLEDVAGYDAMPEQQQRIVQHFLSLTQSEYTYERMLRDGVPELIMAHHPNLKRREEVVHRAMQTDIGTGSHADLDFSVHRLVQLWPVLNAGAESPVNFTDEDTEELAARIGAWNQELMRNKYLESKGFVPADEFDTLLGTGVLKVIDEKKGDYELTKEYLDSQDPLKGI